MITINLQILFILMFSLIFLWTAGIGIGTVIIPYSIFVVYFSFFIFFIKEKSKFLNKILYYFWKTPLKFLILFVLWAILSSFFVTSISNAPKIIARVLRDYIVFVMPFCLIGIFFIPKYISFTKLKKILLNIILIVNIYGIFDYLIQVISPDLHLFLFKFFYSLPLEDRILNRAMSVFFEPTFFGAFLFCFLPLVYNNFLNSPMRFNNKIFLFSLSLLILTWINLLLTKSPIFLVFAMIYTAFHFRKNIFKIFFSIKRLLLIFAIVAFVIGAVALLSEIFDISDTKVLSRIFVTIKNMNSMSNLIVADGSFATRIGLYAISLLVFIKHPFVGYGYANTKEVMYNQICNSPIPLTDEIINSNNMHQGLTVANILLQTLCWTGIIGAALLYIFFIKTILTVNKIIKTKQNNEETRFIRDLNLVGINYIIYSAYWSLITDTLMWFVFSILIAYIIFSKKNKLSSGGIG